MIVDRAAILAAVLLAPGFLHAAAVPDAVAPCPAGRHFTTIRTSRIKPDGSMAAFRRAEADQEAWYAAHKLPDRLFVAPVLTRSAGKLAVSDSEVMTFHVHRGDRTQAFPPRDAGWTAFVGAFRANSQIVSTSHVCLPD